MSAPMALDLIDDLLMGAPDYDLEHRLVTTSQLLEIRRALAAHDEQLYKAREALALCTLIKDSIKVSGAKSVLEVVWLLDGMIEGANNAIAHHGYPPGGLDKTLGLSLDSPASGNSDARQKSGDDA